MTERDYELADRMTEHEALMWNIEKDPWLNPSGASLAILDQPVDMDYFHRQVRFGVAKMPRLYQRVVPGFGRLSTPAWVPDTEFDLAYHVRQIDLPEPGTDEQLFDLAAALYAEPLDRTRPLWRFVAIGGLADGRGAIWAIFHHAISDGIGQLRMAELYQQVKRNEPPAAEVDIESIIAEAAAARDPKELGADYGANLWATATTSLGHVARRNIGIGKRVLGQAAIVPADPQRAVEAAGHLGAAARATVEQLTGSANDTKGGSELWSQRSRHRHLEHVKVPLDELKTAAHALGGSVNDAFMVGLTEAAVRYHAERDAPVEAFNTSFVVSTRTDNKVGGNSFTPVPVQIPGGVKTFRDRMADVRRVSDSAKARAQSGGSIGNLSAIVNLLPTSVVTRTARSQAAKLDFATSNLRGAPFQLFCAGAEVLSTVPMGPLAGTPANITALSYNGMVDLGIFVDPVAIEDPAAYRNHIEAAFADLLAEHATKPKAAAKPATKRRTKAKTGATKTKAKSRKPATKTSTTKGSTTKERA